MVVCDHQCRLRLLTVIYSLIVSLDHLLCMYSLVSLESIISGFLVLNAELRQKASTMFKQQYKKIQHPCISLHTHT